MEDRRVESIVGNAPLPFLPHDPDLQICLSIPEPRMVHIVSKKTSGLRSLTPTNRNTSKWFPHFLQWTQSVFAPLEKFRPLSIGTRTLAELFHCISSYRLIVPIAEDLADSSFTEFA